MQTTGRINWIDWAKAMAATTVVFCHLPQSQEWFYYRYLQSFIITIFFFLSGYLKRDRGSMGANWRKYLQSLVVPYVLLNLAVYPVWLSKFCLLQGHLPTFSDAMRPLLGMVLMESETSFSEPLSGPLWYLPAILAMHLITDYSRRSRHFHAIMVILCLLSVGLYAANKYWSFAPYLAVMGFVRRLPYYYIGYVMGRQGLFANCRARRDALTMAVCLLLSLPLFYWHLHEERFLLHIALFYPVNILFLLWWLSGCKLLNAHAPRAVVRLSVGTLIVIGFHPVLISVANYIVEHCRHLHTVVIYHWYEALPLSLLIVAVLYPLVLLAMRHFPALIGKK